ncbi:MBL fold metallo-hydrolase [Nocardioides sp.]|uniref:MBL fold metallo-hydrolase n=1 Tax=Nocardioides sp. TaxID=35761 RepID=UPI00261B6199|nr:MBL fold metallo-hydrolase [Nocardioides sp.]
MCECSRDHALADLDGTGGTSSADSAGRGGTSVADQATGASRRSVLAWAGIGGLSALAAGGLGMGGLLSPAAAAPAASSTKVSSRTRAILVGTAGGPIWRQAAGLRGISTVVEVAGARYLVDAGHGSAAGLWGAGAVGPVDGRNDLSAYRAGFITHLHSDHVTDLSTFLVQGFIGGGLGTATPFQIHGPGERGQLPHPFPPSRPVSGPFHPASPTPGTVETVQHLLAAFATDINDRIYDAGSPLIDQVVSAHDIALPAGVTPAYDGTAPAMTPFTVYEDERVRVSAVLVAHGQMVPAYAFRFDSDDGAIVISGDTTLTPNLLTLADGADLLLHEIIDYDSVNASIEALSVSDAQKEAFRNHMFGAHTTEAQLKQLVREIDVKTLALHHVVPGSLGPQAWQKIAQRIGKQTRTTVVAGTDNQVIGLR